MTTTFIRSGRALHRNVGPDVLAMVPGQGAVHLLQGPAAVIWDILEVGSPIADVAGEVARSYGKPTPEIRRSIEDCVQQLVERRLVVERRA